jgi:hypothetical protein
MIEKVAPIVSQQPATMPQLTVKELEQVREMQYWAQIRRERRQALGLPAEGTNKLSETEISLIFCKRAT